METKINEMFNLSVSYINDYKIYVISESIELMVKPTEINITDNAIDFTYPGGVLGVRIENILAINNDERTQNSIIKVI